MPRCSPDARSPQTTQISTPNPADPAEGVDAPLATAAAKVPADGGEGLLPEPDGEEPPRCEMLVSAEVTKVDAAEKSVGEGGPEEDEEARLRAPLESI